MDLFESGAARRDEALGRMEAKASGELLAMLRRELSRLLIELDEVTPDDLRGRVQLPSDVNPTIFGAVFRRFSADGLIELAGYRRSVRPEAHARPVGIWRALDRPALHELMRASGEAVV
jgi:hypothetical protein